jgi:hypothetical protein
VAERAVTVQFKVSVSDLGGGGAPITFSRWLPRGREHGITFVHGPCSGVLWFDAKCASWINDEASIERTVNVLVETILIDVVTRVESELAAWMEQRDCRRAPPADQKEQADAYERHGHTVMAAVDHALNRFLSFVRIEKGQFGVRRLSLDENRLSGHAIGMHGQAQFDGGEWFRWCPSNVISFVATMPNENDPRFLRPDDWPHAQEYVSSKRKPTLALELLAGAEALVHRR